MESEKVRYTELRPGEFLERLNEKPIAYLPLGTLEWHGEHLPLGTDAIISEGVMVECAQRFGGIVMPPIHLGPDRTALQDDGATLHGMDTSDKTTPNRQLPGSCYWVSEGFYLSLIDEILKQIKRAGFQAVFASGHGPSNRSWNQNREEREKRFGMKLLGVPPDFAKSWKIQNDHAAISETSAILAIRPELADLSQLPEDRAIWPQGVNGRQDPRDGTAELGKENLEATTEVVKGLFEESGLI